MAADGRANNGGRRIGAGRKPTLKPLKALRLREDIVQQAVVALTMHARQLLGHHDVSQEEVVAELILHAYEDLGLLPIDYADNQSPSAIPGIEYRTNQSCPDAPAELLDDELWTGDLPRRSSGPLCVYQFHIALAEVMPQIWRRILVRSDSTIADLHHVIQIAFGWEDAHLHRFGIHGDEYGIWQPGGISFSTDPTAVQLGHFGFQVGDGFGYEYDFGDSWIHELEIEEILPLSPRKKYPQCIAGALPGPPEDCGGAWAYMEKQRRSARAKAAAKRRQKTGAAPTKKKKKPRGPRFDRASINRRLAAYGAGREDW